MLSGQNTGQLLASSLISTLQHHASTLLGRREALEDVGGRALQADGGGIDQGIVLQVLITQSGQGLAVSLEHAANITKEGDTITVQRMLEDGYMTIKVQTPCLITCIKELNNPRYMSIGGILSTYSKPLTTLGYEDLKDDPLIDATTIGLKGSPTNIFKSFTPPQKGAGMMLEGADKATCEKLAGILAAKHII